MSIPKSSNRLGIISQPYVTKSVKHAKHTKTMRRTQILA